MNEIRNWHSFRATRSLSSLQLKLDFGDEKSIRDTQERAKRYKVFASFIIATPNKIILGSSTTQLFRNVTFSLRPYLNTNSEMIDLTLCHKAGISA